MGDGNNDLTLFFFLMLQVCLFRDCLFSEYWTCLPNGPPIRIIRTIRACNMIFVLRATPTITVRVARTCADHVTINSDITPVRRPATLSVWPVGKANTAQKVIYICVCFFSNIVLNDSTCWLTTLISAMPPNVSI